MCLNQQYGQLQKGVDILSTIFTLELDYFQIWKYIFKYLNIFVNIFTTNILIHTHDTRCKEKYSYLYLQNMYFSSIINICISSSEIFSCYTLHCILYSVLSTLNCTVYCELQSDSILSTVHCTLYSILSTILCTVYSKLYNLTCIEHYIHTSRLRTVQYTVY